MSVIVTRAGKGATLSWVEADANFINLNNDKLEAGTPATNIAVTPTGGIVATDVQSALAELDTELSGTVTKTASTGAAVIPTGTTANRPEVPIEGHFRRNSELGQWEGYDGSQWSDVGGVSLDAVQTVSNKTLVTTEVSGALDFADAVASLSVQSVSSITFDSAGIISGYKDNTITPEKLTQKLSSGTAVTASGTAVDFTGIPSWVKKITVMFSGVSTNGTSYPLVQLGTGETPTTSGYVSQASQLYTAAYIASTTSGFCIYSNSSTYVLSGTMTINNISGNIWVESSCFGSTAGSLLMTVGSGTVTLGGVLNRLRITTVNGTDTFDAGSVNIMWE